MVLCTKKEKKMNVLLTDENTNEMMETGTHSRDHVQKIVCEALKTNTTLTELNLACCFKEKRE